MIRNRRQFGRGFDPHDWHIICFSLFYYFSNVFPLQRNVCRPFHPFFKRLFKAPSHNILFDTYYEMIQETQSVFKIPACVFTLFPNKFACMYDNKQASKQIPWIDEFQNEKDIQLSLVNIMPFRYRAALLHWLSSARSINSLVWVRAWVTRMTFFASQESCLFFSQSFLCRPTLYTNGLKCI